MKVRPFLTVFTTIFLSLFLVGFGFGGNVINQSPIRIVEDQSLELPLAAKFAPRDAAVTLHWMIPQEKFSQYLEGFSVPGEQRNLLLGMQGLRHGLFALVGIDYEIEISNWVGSQISLSLLKPNDFQEFSGGWVLALSTLDKEGAKTFLESFWASRSSQGIDVDVATYKGFSVTSQTSPLTISNSSDSTIASSMVSEELILIASSKESLQRAVDVSESPENNQLGDVELQGMTRRFGSGVALLTASSSALNTWIGFPEAISRRNDLKQFVGALQLKENGFLIEGLLVFIQPLEPWLQQSFDLTPLIDMAGGPAESLAFMDAPYRLFNAEDQSFTSQWLGSIFRNWIGQDSILERIASGATGPLLWLQEPEGWIVGTQFESSKELDVNKFLEEKGFVRSDFVFDDDLFQGWLRFFPHRVLENDEVDVDVGVVLSRQEENALWGKTFAALQSRKEKQSLQPRLSQWLAMQNDRLNVFSNSAVFGPDSARQLLRGWEPWSLLKIFAGPSLESSVKGLAIGFGSNEDVDNSELGLRAFVSFS